MAPVKVDYLVIGAGAMGLAFADQLLTDSDATIAIVDRRHRPGGHWNDAYPFVRLHQPSSYYGVNSRPLGSGAKDTQGFNAGFDELASGPEILTYFEGLMNQRLLPSGRVRYFPMSEYTADGLISSLVSGATQQVSATRVVDAASLSPGIPATSPPQYAVAEGMICAPINDLPRLARPDADYVIVGAGKTGMDACLWLLQNRAEPEQIRWIVPRDSWMFNREKLQSGQGDLLAMLHWVADEVEAIAGAASVADVFLRLEARRAVLRLDPAIVPTMHHCATVNGGELAALQQIDQVIRLGRVQRIDRDRIVLEGGTVPTDSKTIHIDCTASAIVAVKPRPVFEPNRINLQSLRLCQPIFSAALTAHLETRCADDAERNALCTVVDPPSDPLGWLRMMAQELPIRLEWADNPLIADFIATSRLDLLGPRLAKLTAENSAELAELQRYMANVEPAIAKLNQLLAAV